MPLGSDYAGQACSLARTLEIVGERWTLLVLRDLFMGVHRFNDLHGRLDIPRAVLSSRLDSLVDHGLVERRPYAPGRDEFHLTAAGRELWPALYALLVWGDRHRPAPGGARRLFTHVACGTMLAEDGECSACAVVPEAGDIATMPGPGVDPARRDDHVSRALRRPHRLLTPVAG
jgi:DNA-binding HxlR family transcriptional regulator